MDECSDCLSGLISTATLRINLIAVSLLICWLNISKATYFQQAIYPHFIFSGMLYKLASFFVILVLLISTAVTNYVGYGLSSSGPVAFEFSF